MPLYADIAASVAVALLFYMANAKRARQRGITARLTNSSFMVFASTFAVLATVRYFSHVPSER